MIVSGPKSIKKGIVDAVVVKHPKNSLPESSILTKTKVWNNWRIVKTRKNIVLTIFKIFDIRFGPSPSVCTVGAVRSALDWDGWAREHVEQLARRR